MAARYTGILPAGSPLTLHAELRRRLRVRPRIELRRLKPDLVLSEVHKISKKPNEEHSVKISDLNSRM
jgi:hypothetical protein